VSSLDAATLTDAAEAACRAGLRAGLAELDARDLAQEALVRALTSSRPPAGVSLAAWVYGIARNLGRDHWKSAQRRELLVDAPESSAQEDDLATVLSVRRAVDELPEPLRAIVTLHELEQHSLRETAEALQIPFDTAKDRLRRAREQLRASLGDDVVASERAHTRRRAAVQGAAIVAGVCALLGDRALATAATATALATAGRLTMRTWMAVTAGGALVAGGFAVGRLTTTPPAIASSRVEARPPPVAMATVPPDAADLLPDAVPPDATAIVHATTPARARPTDNQDERLLLDRARAGMQRGLYSEALVTLMSHARRFPDGALAEERDVLIIESYARSGQVELARRRIAQYRSAYPTGVLRTRVSELEATL
jgi:RNA polymerase sigma factor (sigma-70 family)